MAKTIEKRTRQALHYPRLDTVMMVEDTVKKAEKYPTRMQLWRALPKGMQYQTFQLILQYLQDSNKLFITKDGRIMWVFADSPKAKSLIGRSGIYRKGRKSRTNE